MKQILELVTLLEIGYTKWLRLGVLEIITL